MARLFSCPALKRWLWGLAALPLLAGALLWLAGSEAALRFAARQAQALSGGKLEISGVHGSLYGPLGIDAFSLRTAEKHIEIQDARLDWSPRGLWQRHLHISQLAVKELRITELKPGTEPLDLPETLALPFSLSVPKASLARLLTRTGVGEQVLHGIALSLDKPAQTYQLRLQAITTPWGQGQAQASLAEAPPFELEGQARLSHASGAATASLAGTLERMRLQGAATLAGGQTRADMVLTPFAPRLLAQARITARGLNPATWAPDLPQADLSLDATLASQGEAAFTGALTAQNARPGTWDRQHLPLRALAANFTGTLEGMDLRDLRLDLGRGGQFTGQGRAEPQGLSLALHTRDFDPRGLHGRMRSLRLAGDIRLRADARGQNLVADLGQGRYRLRLDADHRDRTLYLNEALLSSGAGRLSLFGSVGLADAHPFELAGALDGFDPAAFGDYPSARIHASFTGSGRLLPQPRGAVRFAIADSHFRRQPLSGQGGMKLSEGRLWDSDVVLQLAGNRLRLQGAFGAAGDHLDFLLRADRPQVVHPSLAGRINATGRVAGSLEAPSGTLELQAEGLGWGQDYRLAGLHVKLRLAQGLAGDMGLDAQLQGLKIPQLSLTRADVAARGQRGRHTLRLTAANPDFDLAAALQGGLSEGGQARTLTWSGQLLRFQNKGRYPMALAAPARLELARDRFRLADARLAFLGGAFNVREARYQAGELANQMANQLASKGEFKGLTLAALGKLGAWPEQVSGDLSLGGEWAFEADEKVNGRATLWREGGDLTLEADPPTALGLQALKLVAEATDNRLQATLEADGDILGRLRATAQSTLSRRDGVWGIAGDTPIQGSADLALRSLAWAAPFVDRSGGVRLDGALKAQVRGDGTLAAPRLTGTLTGEGFKLAMPAQGLDFRDGRFQAELKQDTLVLQNLSLRGGDGQLTGRGRLALRDGQPGMNLDLRADKLRVVFRPDRLLILSGGGQLALVENRLGVTAQLRADRGQVELAPDDTPQISTDVVVLGRQAPAKAQGRPYAIRLDLGLDLGNAFYLKGRGLDAQLGGAVKLTGQAGASLNARGSIRVVKGAYSAYGQRLEIERGLLNFQGPLDNPGLNILAMRKNQEVEAGVAVTGSAQAPVVKLVSNPTVPDGEKLAWLVLGHGVAESGAKEFDALQLAAGALLGAGESVNLQQRIAHAAGLEEVSLKGAGTLESTVLTLGKRLSSRAYLSYEQGLTGTEALVKINYTLTRRLSLHAQAGTTPAVDLFYTFSFD